MNEQDRFDGQYRRPRPHFSDEKVEVRTTVDRRQLLTGGAMLLGLALLLIPVHGAYWYQGSRSIYAYGWLLDIARGMHTLVTGRLTTKTAAAQWALDERLCPCPAELAMALTVRRQPDLIRDASVLDYAEGLTGAIQEFADLLEQAIAKL